MKVWKPYICNNVITVYSVFFASSYTSNDTQNIIQTWLATQKLHTKRLVNLLQIQTDVWYGLIFTAYFFVIEPSTKKKNHHDEPSFSLYNRCFVNIWCLSFKCINFSRLVVHSTQCTWCFFLTELIFAFTFLFGC